ncbi:S-layer homology domain-containing protein [Solibacillus sp. FSL R5-0449]|uniref:S-layer homology domain-containing protein n=1 Tax=Solibacillus sp. FSL R5-0449 TaxID=2921639 RepID=UPI0030D1ED0F
MANQPKKYTKFVATAATATLVASAIVPVASAASLSDISGNTHEEAINALVDAGVINGYPDGTFKPNKELTRSDVVKLLGKYLEAEGYAPASTWKTSPAFADLKTTSNEELLKYASVVKEAGVFVGSHGNLLPGDLITRENMALTLVRMVNTLKDLSLEEFVADQDFTGDVKDTNQAKAEARSAIAVLDFFDITNPAVSNFNPKGNTTRGQFATFLYKTANTDFGKAPSNEASEVVPEKLELVERSVQSNDGEFVTLKVKVTTKAGESAANIPVTITIDPGNDQLLTPQIKEEVLTDAEGFATYTYTREYSKSFEDTVVAYSSVKSTVRTTGVVYWNQSVAIKDVTEKTELANGEQKVYQITGEENAQYYVTFKENLNVTPDKAVNAKVLGLGGFVGGIATNKVESLYEFTTGGHNVALVTLDENGKANIVITGTDASVTPVVYASGGTRKSPVSTAKKYSASALQAQGTTAKFTAEALYDLTIQAEGKQESAYRVSTPSTLTSTSEIGGRDYVVTLKDKAGKVLPNTEVKVGFSKNTGTSTPTDVVVYANKTAQTVTSDSGYVTVKTDKDGKAKFTVTGLLNGYATPVAFIGDSLTDNKISKTGEITYFRSVYSNEYTSALKVTDSEGNEITKAGQGNDVNFTYQLSDQNGKPRSYTSPVGTPSELRNTPVTFTVRAGSTPVTVTVPATTNVVSGQARTVVIPAFETKEISTILLDGSVNTAIQLTTVNPSEVTVTATPTNSGLSGLTSISKSIEFISGAATPTFTVNANVVNNVTTTVDSVTLTFSEAVSTNEIIVTGFNGGTTSVSPTADNKVLNVYFYGTKLSATPNNTFSISYKGKTYNFEYNVTNGAVRLISTN